MPGNVATNTAPLVGAVRNTNGRRLIVTAQKALVLVAPSYAVSRRMYFPLVLNVAVVLVAFSFANVTGPGPLATVHFVVKAPGNPSSEALPARLVLFATPSTQVNVRSGPALTTGRSLMITVTGADVVLIPLPSRA